MYTLWDAYNQRKELERKAAEAEKRAAFIQRRKARAQAKAAERTAASIAKENAQKVADDEHESDTR